jgi:hypothetical protein
MVYINNLNLNINRYKFMHYNLIKIPIIFFYSIFNTKIGFVHYFIDLGIIFYSKLNFTLHTETIKNKPMRNLGLI